MFLLIFVEELCVQSYYYFGCNTQLVEFPQASMQIPIGQNRKRGRPNKTKKALVRQNENNSLSPRSSQTDSSTSESDNSSLLVDRILNANKRFRDQNKKF